MSKKPQSVSPRTLDLLDGNHAGCLKPLAFQLSPRGAQTTFPPISIRVGPILLRWSEWQSGRERNKGPVSRDYNCGLEILSPDEEAMWINLENVYPATVEFEDKHFWPFEHDRLVIRSSGHYGESAGRW